MNKLDALVAAPDSHKLLFENEKVRVLEVIIEPGKKEPDHIHELPSVMIVTDPAKIRYYNADQTWLDIKPEKQTKTEWIDPEELHQLKILIANPTKPSASN